MTKHDAIKHLSYKIAYAEQCDDEWVDSVSIKALYIAVRAMAEEREKGKWINGRCSKCGEHAPFERMSTTYHASNFCPNCGRKMRGEAQLWIDSERGETK